MASLDDLATIDENSLKEPPASPQPGDPVAAARSLRRRLRMLMVRKAYNWLDIQPPSETEPQKAYNEQLALAQRILNNPDAFANSAVLMVLGNASLATPASDILNLEDQELNAILTPARLARLARGLSLG